MLAACPRGLILSLVSLLSSAEKMWGVGGRSPLAGVTMRIRLGKAQVLR